MQPVKIVDGSKKKPRIATVVSADALEVLLKKDGKILKRNQAHVKSFEKCASS